ncbi:MAG: ferredoxin [Desulfovibrionaceae bacterium]
MSQLPTPSTGSAGAPNSELKDVALDQVSCHGCLGCVEAAPHLFAYDEENDRIVILQAQATEEDIHEAIKACPKDCISLE